MILTVRVNNLEHINWEKNYFFALGLSRLLSIIGWDVRAFLAQTPARAQPSRTARPFRAPLLAHWIAPAENVASSEADCSQRCDLPLRRRCGSGGGLFSLQLRRPCWRPEWTATLSASSPCIRLTTTAMAAELRWKKRKTELRLCSAERCGKFCRIFTTETCTRARWRSNESSRWNSIVK